MTAIATEKNTITEFTPAQLRANQARQQTKRKYVTSLYIYPLINLHSTNEKSYWKVWNCSDSVTQVDSLKDGALVNSRLLTKHCKLKYCIVCALRRTRELVISYKPTLDSWQNKHFVTLTVKSCTAGQLRSTLDTMHKALSIITKSINKTRKAHRLHKLQYVAHFETTFKPYTNTYHPHIHFITYDWHDAHELRTSWQNKFEDWQVDEKGQDITPADENSTKELFKYFTKIIDESRKGKGLDRTVHVEALDTIFTATIGKRTFTASGVRKIKDSKKDYQKFLDELERDADTTIVTTFDYDRNYGVYLDEMTGEILAQNYFPKETFDKIRIIDRNPLPVWSVSVAPLKARSRARKRKEAISYNDEKG